MFRSICRGRDRSARFKELARFTISMPSSGTNSRAPHLMLRCMTHPSGNRYDRSDPAAERIFCHWERRLVARSGSTPAVCCCCSGWGFLGDGGEVGLFASGIHRPAVGVPAHARQHDHGRQRLSTDSRYVIRDAAGVLHRRRPRFGERSRADGATDSARDCAAVCRRVERATARGPRAVVHCLVRARYDGEGRLRRVADVFHPALQYAGRRALGRSRSSIPGT